MKIIWLNNTLFSDDKIKTTGTWTYPLASALSNNVDIINIVAGSVDNIEYNFVGRIKQYTLPYPKTKWYGHIADKRFCQIVQNIIYKENPDIVHLWGSEGFWGSLYINGYIDRPVLLEMQGVLHSYYYYYYGGLKTSEILKSVYLKEILMPWRTLFNKKKIFRKRGEYEKKLISKVKYINVQSDWTKCQVKNINQNVHLFETGILLRNAFYNAESWRYHATNKPIVFTTASGAIPYKGIHIALQAIRILKKTYPDIKLHIAGQMMIGNKLIDGYSLYIKSLIKKLNLEDNIVFLGSIDENEIVHQLQICDVCLITSFVETYCLAFAESMIVGVPTVASYAGAMPELAENDIEALFYSPMDFITCADKLNLLINDKQKATNISKLCRERRMQENDKTKIIQKQVSIYNAIIQNK